MRDAATGGRENTVEEMGQGSEEGMHKCQKCGQTFNTQQELDTHMEEQHGGETPEMGDALVE